MNVLFSSGLLLSTCVLVGSLGLVAQPGSTTPSQKCKVKQYDCRPVGGFCENQVTVPGNPPTTSHLKVCDNGVSLAPSGVSGQLSHPSGRTTVRNCTCYTSTLIWDCNSTPPGGGYVKLDSCGNNGSGQCCYGSGGYTCETLTNSNQEELTNTACVGPATP